MRLKIQGYKFTVLYHTGKDNLIVDLLPLDPRFKGDDIPKLDELVKEMSNNNYKNFHLTITVSKYLDIYIKTNKDQAKIDL